MSYGKIQPKGTMYLRELVGTLKDDEGNVYEAYNVLQNRDALIYSPKTGKYFHLGWEDIVAMAVKAGIDKEDEPKKIKRTHRLIYWKEKSQLIEIHGNGTQSILRKRCTVDDARALARDMELELAVE